MTFSAQMMIGLKLQVLQRHFLRQGKILGSFKLDVATVMSQPGSGNVKRTQNSAEKMTKHEACSLRPLPRSCVTTASSVS